MESSGRTYTVTEEEMATERNEFLTAFYYYLRNRRTEVAEAIGDGAICSGDPYLQGYSRGHVVGLDMAIDLISSFSEFADKGIFYPDEKAARHNAELI